MAYDEAHEEHMDFVNEAEKMVYETNEEMQYETNEGHGVRYE